jgi:tetratricopeptide (TPR) repeat protein
MDGLFIGLIETGNNQLQNQKRYAAAVQTFKLATEVNLERPGVFFYLAWAHAGNGDKKRALKALKSAVDKGYSDLAGVVENRVFDLLRGEEQYKEIIQILQSKH